MAIYSIHVQTAEWLISLGADWNVQTTKERFGVPAFTRAQDFKPFAKKNAFAGFETAYSQISKLIDLQHIILIRQQVFGNRLLTNVNQNITSHILFLISLQRH